MIQESNNLYVDEAVALQIVQLVEEAEEYAVLVTPYLSLWGHLRNAITIAKQGGTDVVFVVRNEEKITDSKDVDWLKSRGVEVLAVDGLHAKIYISERTTILSSMNVTDHSTRNTLEFAVEIADEVLDEAIRDYVSDRLMLLAKPVGSPLGKMIKTLKQFVGKSAAGFCIKMRHQHRL